MRGKQGNIGIIPKEVADKLRGKRFKSFDYFREAFWKSVANSKYASEFSANNVARMRKGNAPIAISEQWYGDHKSYILHHRTPIQHGGDVYNSDNSFIFSPRMHQEILDKSYHFGSQN
ncbi:colicin [Thermoactinomyces sp. CICC 10521]|jgi:hypothetical protein|nr:colicin [Thermoactinomyces sp. CICC 10521]